MLKNYLEPDSQKDVFRKGKLVEELQERNTELLAQNNQLKLENAQLRKQLEIRVFCILCVIFFDRTRPDQELRTMERKLQELLENYGERSRYAHSW